MSARRRKRAGRRPGSSGESRDAILKAARELFAKHGFRGTTMRAVAERAGVDLALVHYFFEAKAKLFAAVVELPIAPERIAALLAQEGPPGERMARFYLEHLFTSRNEAISAVLRAALGDPDCIPALRALIQGTLVAGAASAMGGSDAMLRAELVGAQMVGLFICRCMVGVEPLASASVDELVARVAPALDALLDPARASRGLPALPRTRAGRRDRGRLELRRGAARSCPLRWPRRPRHARGGGLPRSRRRGRGPPRRRCAG